jgi:ParB family chromosome partitioning protein
MHTIGPVAAHMAAREPTMPAKTSPTATDTNRGAVTAVPLDSIQPGNNDRAEFDSVAIQELAESMQNLGLAQPITVRPISHDRWEIVAGERRYRAAKHNQWPTIDCLIRDLTDEQASGIMLAENLMRADLNPIDEALAYKKRMDQFGWDLETVARNANMTSARVRSRLDLLSLIWEAQCLVKSGNLTMGYAELMLGLDSNRQVIALRYFSQAKRPNLPEFRTLCAKLLQEQAQNAMFDLDAFFVKQEDIQQRTGKRAFPYPVSESLPPLKPARSVDASLEQYLAMLLTTDKSGYREAAEIVATVYKGLVDGNLA